MGTLVGRAGTDVLELGGLDASLIGEGLKVGCLEPDDRE
jgi:hypothetical protein